MVTRIAKAAGIPRHISPHSLRHAAITKNLYTWSSYKHWADKVKGSWEEEPAAVPVKK